MSGLSLNRFTSSAGIAAALLAGCGGSSRRSARWGPDRAFITGSDFLQDGGVTAAYWFGELGRK